MLRSIDMGAMEVVNTFEELQDYCKIGSPFSIPKAALTLAGFGPAFSEVVYPSLEKQLQAFGTGIEITCLLYTSPSPRDRQKSRMPSSA